MAQMTQISRFTFAGLVHLILTVGGFRTAQPYGAPVGLKSGCHETAQFGKLVRFNPGVLDVHLTVDQKMAILLLDLHAVRAQ